MLKFTTEKEYDGYLNVNSCGQQWLTDRDYNTLRENGRIDYSIYYIANGKGYFNHDGKSYIIPEGSLVVYFPNVRHNYYFKKEDGTRMLWSHFSGSGCSMLNSLSHDCPTVVPIVPQKQFVSAFEKMIDAHYNKQEMGNNLCNGYMSVILALIEQSTLSAKKATGNKSNKPLEQVLSRMHVEFDQPIDISEYAKMCHLSEDRFIKLFKAHTGCPPYRYQLRLRIERAAEMLENYSVSVSECAEVVGFNDVAYFSRVFKKFTGHPPSYYKHTSQNK